jgi:rfaE bifunctional protein kinase chain/domain
MTMKRFEGCSRERLEEILHRSGCVKVVLLGDLCLDCYWSADMTRSVLSRETPHFPLPVTEERMSPGAGGNAACNLAALKPQTRRVVGVLGQDWRGWCLTDAFAKLGVSDEGFVPVPGRVTNAYCKPMRRGYSGVETEDPRLDFESFEPLSTESEEALVARLLAATADADLLCVSDQFEFGCVTPRVREAVQALADGGLRVVVDSRTRIGLYRRAVLKPNEIEAARALGWESDRLSGRNATEADLAHAAQELAVRNESTVCLTAGDRGCVVGGADGATVVPGRAVLPPVDPCGAGDCFLSAFSLALAAGATEEEAAFVGNLAASVSVKKIGTTGTATAEEILARFDELRREGA